LTYWKTANDRPIAAVGVFQSDMAAKSLSIQQSQVIVTG
jgi:hypothetical protein